MRHSTGNEKSLVIRISPELLDILHQAARDENTTASETVRRLIRDYVERRNHSKTGGTK